MNLTIHRLQSLLSYDPETGCFRWLAPRPYCSTGKLAGGLTSYGYIRISVDGRPYQAHRLAWFYVHGRWPSNEIDHVNGVRSDNRLTNLREATPSQNQANKRIRKDNTSGVKGVTWDKSRGKWLASIHINGKRLGLGRHQTLEQAARAYEAAASLHFGEFARPERAVS